jgi:hypothetical protein
MGCTYLGNFESEPQQIRVEKDDDSITTLKDEKSDADKTKKAPAVTCPSCNVEMCQAKTKIRIDGWEGLPQKVDGGDLGKLREESLPVMVYLCKKCGRMEFVALEETKQRTFL